VCWEAGRKPGGLGLGFEIKAGLFEKRTVFFWHPLDIFLKVCGAVPLEI